VTLDCRKSHIPGPGHYAEVKECFYAVDQKISRNGGSRHKVYSGFCPDFRSWKCRPVCKRRQWADGAEQAAGVSKDKSFAASPIKGHL